MFDVASISLTKYSDTPERIDSPRTRSVTFRA